MATVVSNIGAKYH